MSISFTTRVQSNSHTGAGENVAVTFSGAGANVAGNLLVASVMLQDNSQTISVSDTNVNNWQQLGTYQGTISGNQRNFALWYAENIAGGGTNVITAVGSVPATAATIRINVGEFASGVAGAPLIHKQFTATQGSSTALDSGPLSLLAAGGLLFGWGQAAGGTFTLGTNFNVVSSSQLINMTTEYQVVTSAGPWDATFSVSPSEAWICALATFIIQPYGISGNAGVGGATISWSGGPSADGSVTADGSGNYNTSEILSPGTYTITPSLAGYTFSPASTSEAITNADISGVNFTATRGGSVWSPVDSRVAKPNFATYRTVNGAQIDDVQTSSNAAVPGVDSRTEKPVPSGTPPQNSRTAPPFKS